MDLQEELISIIYFLNNHISEELGRVNKKYHNVAQNDCSETSDTDAALAAGIFNRKEVPIAAVKEHLRKKGIPVR